MRDEQGNHNPLARTRNVQKKKQSMNVENLVLQPVVSSESGGGRLICPITPMELHRDSWRP